MAHHPIAGHNIGMKHKLFVKSTQLLPELIDEEREVRPAVTRRILIALYTVPLGLLALIWLLSWTPLVAVNNQGLLILLLATFLGVGALAHYLNRQVVAYERHSRQLHYLERLAQAILHEPSDNTDLSHLLVSFLPQLYPDEWVEIRLLPEQILYFQGEGWVATENKLWQQMVESEQLYWREPALPEAVAYDYSPNAFLVPIRSVSNQEVIGGIYLLPHTAGDGLTYLDLTQKLAGYIAAHIHRVESYYEALTTQAEAYKKEIYAQVYQSEVVVQTLAYERMEKELLVAGEIQSTMLPQHIPELPGWQLSVVLEPARETSGDFYDFIPLPNGRIGLVVADVADKGVGAALYMALSRTLIRVFAHDYCDDPAQALTAANQRILSDTNSDLFVTVSYIVLDPENGQLTYCNAGHPPPFILSTSGVPPQALTLTGLPLGIFDDVPWQQGSAHMQQGDVLVLYTDGVTEAEDEMANFFGERRLQAITRKFIKRSPAIIESKILNTIYDFMGEAPQHDDITLMIVTREPMPK